MKKNCRPFSYQVRQNPSIPVNAPAMESLFEQYEKVIVKSIITSFGLDNFIQDHIGGDVDTIHNVRNGIEYKKEKHKQDYANLGAYDGSAYHGGNPKYRNTRKEMVYKQSKGSLRDGYTGKVFKKNESFDVEHVISSKSIHEDPGRVLAKMQGEDLANMKENLVATTPSINRPKKEKDVETFLSTAKNINKRTSDNIKKKEEEARAAIEARINAEYYTSADFLCSAGEAAAKRGFQVGLRQAIGFCVTEIWISIKDVFKKSRRAFSSAKAFFKAIAIGIKNGLINCKNNLKALFDQFKDGALAGIMSSITTTLCNIFFTTYKIATKIIRQAWTSLVEAVKILVINPDQLQLGDKLLAASKVIATGASIIFGTLISYLIDNSIIGQIPTLGSIISTFCGAFVTGILSCSLLYLLDTLPIIKKLINFINKMVRNPEDELIDFLNEQSAALDAYGAKIMKIDLKTYKKEVKAFSAAVTDISKAKNEIELNLSLKRTMRKMNITPIYDVYGSMDKFMNNKSAILKFA